MKIFRDNSIMKIAAICLSQFVALAIATSGASAGEKKIIELGWDIPTTGYMKDHWEAMEQEGPFDGVIFKVIVEDGEKKYDSSWGWDTQGWRREPFSRAIEDLRACKFTRFTDNFLLLNFSPGEVEWNDDDGWKRICEKAGILAWVAKQAGAKGLALDFEPYGKPMFQYQAKADFSFSEAAALARRRGAEVMDAIAREYPDAVLLTLFLNSVNVLAGRSEYPDMILNTGHYGLLPAFVNGMLDRLSSEMILVDGCENGYYLDGRLAYLKVASDMKSWHGPSASLVAPENRAKYRTQVQAGFGFYLDMYLNEQGNQYYFGPKPGGTRLDRLRDNLSAALEASDEYVWLYGEQCRWWKASSLGRVAGTVGQGKLWEEALPGVSRTIAYASDPLKAAYAEVEAGKAENLVRNGDFSSEGETKQQPANWTTWQEVNSQGRLTWDPQVGDGSAKAAHVLNGCFLQDYPASPGDRFFVRAQCKSTASSTPNVIIRWQLDDHWAREDADVTLTFPPGEAEWRTCRGAVTVPEGADKLLVLLMVRNQMTENDACWFDNIEVHKLSDKPTPEE
jgi:hypothetical protein